MSFLSQTRGWKGQIMILDLEVLQIRFSTLFSMCTQNPFGKEPCHTISATTMPNGVTMKTGRTFSSGFLIHIIIFYRFNLIPFEKEITITRCQIVKSNGLYWKTEKGSKDEHILIISHTYLFTVFYTPVCMLCTVTDGISAHIIKRNDTTSRQTRSK